MTFLSRTRLPVLFIGLLATVTVISGMWLLAWLPVEIIIEPEQPLAEVVTSVYAVESSEWVPELPVRILIPAIGVDAAVQSVGLVSDGSGAMAVPSNFTDVGWYQPGVRPGMRGSAVMAGHYNGRGIPEAVFFNLEALRIGDEVVILSAERIEDIFVVVRIATYAYDAPVEEVFISTDGRARLNLITCGGQWLASVAQYDKRTVVFTVQATDVE